MAMLVSGSPRAAYFYEVPDTSTFRYRAYNVCQSLAAESRGGPSASWFHCGDLDWIERVIDQCDVLIRFEATAVGAVTVAAPTYTFRNVIVHGKNGWLAPTYTWEEILREVIRGGEACWRPLAVRARADVEERFGWSHQAAAIRSALFDW
jgi:hypothetical protein